MLSINTNLSSLITQHSMKSATNLLNQAVERMSTGYKVNHAKDNAAAYSIITNMDTKIGAYQVAEDNVAMGLDMLTTATESLDLIYDKLTRLRDLAEQASNGTYGEQSKKAINSEANALVDEIERLYSTAEYNKINLFESQNEEAGFITPVAERSLVGMTSLSSITDESQDLAVDTYTIGSVAELEKLARITNSGKLTAGCEFVLTEDLDLSSISNWTPIGDGVAADGTTDITTIFRGTFDGNGHVISNLKSNGNDQFSGLFGAVSDIDTTIKNLGVENAEVSSTNTGEMFGAGALIGACFGESALNGGDFGAVNVENCYSTGRVSSTDAAGGLVGLATLTGINMENCWSSANITQTAISGFGQGAFGGIAGYVFGYLNSDNCYSLGDVTVIQDDAYAGGFVGYTMFDEAEGTKIANSISAGKVTAPNTSQHAGGFIGYTSGYDGCIDNCLYNNVDNSSLNPIEFENGSFVYSLQGKARGELEKILTNYQAPKTIEVNLQVGINSKSSSNITLETSFVVDNLYSLRGIGLDENDYLSQIDSILDTVSAKQTEYGAVQNRLESALEEIATQYENLVSSRSTLRDADIAEVSSHYIQQQILQQASATLMATANQAPAIALQLI